MAARAPDITVVIVTYNSAPFVEDCLRSLPGACGERTWEVIAVDNGSVDGTVELLERSWPNVQLRALGRNTGFAAACNRAIERTTGSHVVLLNGDAVAEPGSLQTLSDHLCANPDVGAVAPRLLNTDLTDQGTARAFPTPAAAVLGRRSPLTRWFPNNRWSSRYLVGLSKRESEPFDVDWVSGACVMVPRHVLADVGGLDERFFMYWEDADLCRRIHKSGRRVACVPAARVVHDEGGSRRGWPPRQVVHFHVSAYRYYAKHHLRGNRVALRPIAAGAMSARAALVIARDGCTTPIRHTAARHGRGRAGARDHR